MIPLVVNSLPPVPATPAPSATANQSLLVQGQTDGSAAARQYLPNAVASTTAPAAYFPGTAPQRQAQSLDRAQTRLNILPPTGDYIEVRDALPSMPTALRTAPVTLGIPLTAQLTAQFISQQPVTAVKADPAFTQEEKPEPNSTKSKDPSFTRARGASAYRVAAARNATIAAKPEIDPA